MSGETQAVDLQLIDDVNAGCIVVFVDEWGHSRTLEARAICRVSGQNPMLVGYQIDAGRAIAPEQLWKRVEVSRHVSFVRDEPDMPARSIPPQYTENVRDLLALAPNTGWDQTPCEFSDDD
ncbi:hypothetical protein DF034_30410 [Burkholderia anthina]|uniref:hypothetical protein n=1 Tax=Burkholderia anthina TaxID=179879 RepID=UPI000F5FFCCD|nr:hypothetical protein [Burkholderia anthina]RQX79149.1 hypothetical protein DF034_30410 [Burkholderia anthina]